MTDEHLKIQQEHNDQHEETLRVLVETDETLASVQTVLSEARKRLQAATEKYEERLHGPTNIGPN